MTGRGVERRLIELAEVGDVDAVVGGDVTRTVTADGHVGADRREVGVGGGDSFGCVALLIIVDRRQVGSFDLFGGEHGEHSRHQPAAGRVCCFGVVGLACRASVFGRGSGGLP
jgi:hypothetical protein